MNFDSICFVVAASDAVCVSVAVQVNAVLSDLSQRGSRRQRGRVMHESDIESIVKGQVMQVGFLSLCVCVCHECDV